MADQQLNVEPVRKKKGIAAAVPGQPVPSKLQAENFGANASGIGGTMDNLRRELKSIEADIKNDKVGKADYENQISRLKRRKADLQARIKENKQWKEAFDRDIGPFETRYKGLVDEIESLYGVAKEKHSAALQILINDFAYHPVFKRWNDEFTAVPFKPH
mmetsp:Transcript_42544/g.51684  ORF Transcript_42544/g.51684 Transcript_42544/m.51684 type:complete len:160 (+) Transcript_42544:349-828(+)